MNAYRVSLFSGISGGSETATIDLGRASHFFAWCQINSVDLLSDFDQDNAVAIEIYAVDNVPTAWRIAGGDHWGSDGAPSNVHEGAVSGVGSLITFRIRAMHNSDLEAFGTGIVLVP